MKPLIESDSEIASRMQQKFGATVVEIARGFQLHFPGVTERFELSTANDELTLFTESWHEHFTDLNELERFLDALFAGTVEIIVTYRGKTPVGHKIKIQRDGGTRVVSQTGILVPLFWRRKSRRTLSYKLSPSHAMQRTAPRPDA